MAMSEQPLEFPAWQQLQDQLNTISRALSGRLDELIHVLGAEDPASRRALLILASMMVLAIGFLLVRLLQRARRRSAVMRAELARVTRRPRFLGYGAALVFLGALSWWATVAELASATLAPAVVSPDGHRKTIQHFEGGIVQAIHVHEGDVVAVGDRLVTLDDTQARAVHRELRERFADLMAQEARLLAEQDGRG
ncbi:MAG: biotin/lipoyl-binding protein, partial [Pseudomonadota bacterium]